MAGAVLTPVDWDGVFERRVVVCLGSGGVGKTTMSATIALEAARRGKRTLVITIDPARRLANALGLEGLGGRPHRIDADLAADLWAMTLNTRVVFDEFVDQVVEDPSLRGRIRDNPFYGHMVTALSGTQQYMAIEKLYELDRQGDYDVIVLDTPPMAHALEILDAPRRMLALMDNRAVQWLIKPALSPGGLGMWMMGKSSALILRSLAVFVGKDFLRELARFLAGLTNLFPAMAERARAVEALLHSRRATFLIVTSPTAETTAEAAYLLEKLGEQHLPFAGFVVNRVHPLWVPGKAARADLPPAAALGDDLRRCLDLEAHGVSDGELETIAGGLLEALAEDRDLGVADLERLEKLGQLRAGGVPLSTVPLLAEDVHDLPGLLRVADRLFGRVPIEA